LLKAELREVVPLLALGEQIEKHQSSIARKCLKELRRQKPELDSLFPRNLAASVYCQVFSLLKNEIITPDTLRNSDGRSQFLDLVARTVTFSPWLDPFRTLPGAEVKARQVLSGLLALYSCYWQQMRRDHRMDFDDQKLIAYLTLLQHPQMAEVIQSRYDAVIVDEFQDINRLDFEFIKVIAARASLVVVGDDDQAIYGFRGCSPRYIIDFEALSSRPTETFKLEVNYRSPRNIVDLSQKLIAHNSVRVPKSSSCPASAPTADIELWHSMNGASEAQVIAKSIKKIVSESAGRVTYGDIAVLFRINSQSLPLQLSLIMSEIPYYCRKEDNILLSEAMERILRLVHIHLALIQGVGFTVAEDAEALYESYFRWHFRANSELFLRLSRQKGGFLRAAVELEAKDSRWRGFAEAIAGLAEPRSPIGTIEYVAETFKNLRGLIGDLQEAIEGHVPLGELIDIARRFKGTTAEFHERLSDLTRKAQQGFFATGEEDGVNLLTYFRAKGRQWHTVILPGANQRVIPDRRAPIEDERRLFYVAVTRPTANLIISYVRHAVREAVTPSQFLTEMGLGDGRERRASTI
jgi:DNA helicase-2/ATP-dependent DNA helicase PcrA